MGDDNASFSMGSWSTDNASARWPSPSMTDHSIVPIWSFALFLLAYLVVSATIRRRYRWRRQMIEAVLSEVEQKRSSGEEVHWPQPRPDAASARDKDSPVTPPKDPSPKQGGKKGRKKNNKNDTGASSKSSTSGRGSPLKRSLSEDADFALGTFEVEGRSADGLQEGSASQPGGAPSRATFDVEDTSAGRTTGLGAPSRGDALVRTVTVMDMGPGAAPENTEAASEIQTEIETELELEKRLPACQRFVRHFLGNLEGLLLVQEFGVEAGFYLALVWMFARFFLCLSVLGLPLAAFYYEYGDRQNADLSCFTAANLAKGSSATGMTVVACCAVLVVAQGLCVYVWSRLQKLKYATSEARTEALSGSTLMIDGLPNDITADDRLVDFLELLVPGWIKNAHIALDLEKLIHIERRLAAARHEHSRAVESRGSCSGSGRVRKAEKLVSKLEREEEETRTTEMKSTGIAFVTFFSLRRAVEFKRAISVKEVPQLYDSPGSTSGKEEAKQKLSVEASEANQSSPSKKAPSISLLDAPQAEELNLFGWKIEVAPDPSDILWENLRISPDSRKRRKHTSRALLLSILLFGSALVLLGVFFLGFHYVNLVYNIEPAAHVTEGLSQVGDGLAEVFGSAYWLVFLAPPAVFLGLITSVPMIAKKLIAIEKHFTRSAVMQSYVAKSFAFYLLLNLILTSCSWVVIVTQSEEMEGRMSKMQIFADLSGTFHICVVLTEAFVMAPHRMYRGWNLHAGVKCVALRAPSFPTPALPFNPTLNSDEMDDDAVLLFDFSKQYAEIFSIFAMLLAYGPLVPCVLPAGWLYFEILLATDQQVLRQQFAKHRTEDKRIRTITSHIQWSAVVAQFVPFVFIVVHGTEVGVIALCVLAVWTLITYVLYIDHADNHGKLFYNKLERCLPCAQTGKSARADVGLSFTVSVDPASLRANSTPTRDFGQLSLARKDSEIPESSSAEGNNSPADNVANPLVSQDVTVSPSVRGGDDHIAPAEHSPYSHPLEHAISMDSPALGPTVAASGPSTFDLDDFRPTPLELDGPNGDRVDQKAQKKKPKRLDGFGLRRKKIDMTPAGAEMEMPSVEGEVSQALDQTMTQFQGKGSFPKRGASLKPTISSGNAIQRVEPVNTADAYHLGGTKLTDGLPLPRSANSGNDGTEGMAFSAFDDMLATATVGGK